MSSNKVDSDDVSRVVKEDVNSFLHRSDATSNRGCMADVDTQLEGDAVKGVNPRYVAYTTEVEDQIVEEIIEQDIHAKQHQLGTGKLNAAVEESASETLARMMHTERGRPTGAGIMLRRTGPVSVPASEPGAFPSGNSSLELDNTLHYMDNHSSPIPRTEHVQQSFIRTVSENLIEAREVSSEQWNLEIPEAAAVDPSLAGNTARHQKGILSAAVAAVAFAVLLCLILGVTLSILLIGQHPSNVTTPFSMGSSIEPSVILSVSPTVAPTLVLATFLANLPQSSLERLEDPFSAQSQAYRWLLNHQNISNLDDWRKRQLFALAVFYYSFGGQHWPEAARRSWLDDTISECNWFSNEFGYFDEDGIYHVLQKHDESHNFGVDICNEQGEFQSIVVDRLDLVVHPLQPSIPPEIGLLSSLVVLACSESTLSVPIDSLLPPELFQLPNLQVLDFSMNGLTGTIPTELGLASNLGVLILYSNELTGTIPIELGELAFLEDLLVEENQLTGSIPRELGRLTSLYFLSAYSNLLSGTIPTELGLQTSLEIAIVDVNILTGPIPSELGLMTNLMRFWAHHNSLSGSIPPEIDSLVANHSMHLLTIANNSLSGTVSDVICAMGNFDVEVDQYETVNGSSSFGVTFDCNSNLCGCTWCPCDPGSRKVSAATDKGESQP